MNKNRQILPTNFVPSHYNLKLFPALQSPFLYQGHVSISLMSRTRTRRIILNAKLLKIYNASIVFLGSAEPELPYWPFNEQKNPKQEATSIALDEKQEIVTLEFDLEIPSNSHLLLHIQFEGFHNDQMCGFYRSSYCLDDDGQKQYIVSTHFEPSDARKAFPCWDEPALKATFDVTLHVPLGYVGLSNMHVIDQEQVEINGVSLLKISFATTPLMSTYLLAFVVGRFSHVEQIVRLSDKEIPCRVYMFPGKEEEGSFSCHLASKIVEFFSNYFQIEYPLPKIDLVGIPDFPIGAMENFGLLTFRVDRLLFNNQTGSVSSKVKVAYIVSHEIAHQWFGNLVTMKWWDELWLKEGFATYVGWLAIDHLFPEWDVFTAFLDQETIYGFQLDSLKSSHPIRVDVASPAEVGEIFDAISYCKGASVIRMLECFLGRHIFATGVCKYLKKHLYGNADGLDLWLALQESSGVEVAALMSNWTEQIGFPVIKIINERYDEENKEMVLDVEQSRFLIDGSAQDNPECIWKVPVGIFTSLSKTPIYTLLEAKQGTVKFPYCKSNDAFWKVNFEFSGFFYTQYTAQYYEELASRIEKDNQCISGKDKYGLLTETYHLVKSGQLPLTLFISFLKCFKNENDFYVLNLIFYQIRSLHGYFASHFYIHDNLNGILKSIFSSKLDECGFDFPLKEDFKVTSRRALVIEALKTCKDIRVVNELYNRFLKYMAGDKTCLSTNILNIAFSSVTQHSTDNEEFNRLLSLYKSSKSLEEQKCIMAGLASSSDLKLVHRWFNEILLDQHLVRTQDIAIFLRNFNRFVSTNRQFLMEIKWEWFTLNFEILKKRMGTKSLPIEEIFDGFIGLDFYYKIQAWCTGVGLSNEACQCRRDDLEASRRQLNQALERMKCNSEFVERNIK